MAAWNTSQKNIAPEIHLFHLQISLYVLFVQLYSMYPCSFVLFLKQQYSAPANHLVFTHTIKVRNIGILFKSYIPIKFLINFII